MEIQAGSFAMIIKRRTILYGVVILFTMMLMFFVVFKEGIVEKSGLLDTGIIPMLASEDDLDENIKWNDFQDKYSDKSLWFI